MSAASMVMGKKMSEFPRLLWSKKFFARVRKVSASSVQFLNGMVTPNWDSSSRSPWSGMKERFRPLTNCRSGPDAVISGGGLGKRPEKPRKNQVGVGRLGEAPQHVVWALSGREAWQ